MALIVTIQVNNKVIRKIAAVRIKGKPHNLCEYKILKLVNIDDEGGIIIGDWEAVGRLKHNYDDGAEHLAMLMLDKIKEEK